MLFIVLALACNDGKHFKLEPKQSAVITDLRARHMLEYSSPLNATMRDTLLQMRNDRFIDKSEYKAIVVTAVKLENEKPKLACYVAHFDFEVNGIKIPHTVVMDWKSDAGVIVRFFTADETAFKKLPSQSF